MISKVLLISPPYMQLSKPDFAIPGSLQKGVPYMNPGLLISASILEPQNIAYQIIKIKDVRQMKELDEALKNQKKPLIGISCTCAWEYLEALYIAEYAKRQNPNAVTYISGWQIKSIKGQVFQDSDYVDYAVIGDAETTLLPLIADINQQKESQICGVLSRKHPQEVAISPAKAEFQVLDFAKYPDYLNYVPYVEESRNCPCSCTFCLNSCVRDRYQIVPFEIFQKNVDAIEKLYGQNADAVLLAANFGVHKAETLKKLAYLKTKKMKWNIELHIDNPWETYLDDLKAAGVCKLSVGFESASPTMLGYMKKTRDAKNYVSRLKLMLTELKKREIRVSLNTLFDYRETPETMAETMDFLQENKELYYAAKMNFMFGFEGVMQHYPDYWNFALKTPMARKTHVYPMLPKGFSIEEMVAFIEQNEQKFKDKSRL